MTGEVRAVIVPERHHTGTFAMDGTTCVCECRACWTLADGGQCLCPDCQDGYHDHTARPEAKDGSG